MPGSMHTIDSGLPRFQGAESTEDKVEAIQNYLFMLMEEMQYVLRNLGEENFNSSSLTEIGDKITKPLTVKLGDVDSVLTEVIYDEEGLRTKIASAEGDISALAQTASGLTTRVQNAEGSISTLTQTAEGLTSRVGTAESNISSLNTAVAGKIDSATAQSLIQQTMSAITLSVSSGSSGSSISLNSGGTTITSPTIDLNVKAANISGKLTASQIETDTLKIQSLFLEDQLSVAVSAEGGSYADATLNLGGTRLTAFDKINLFANSTIVMKPSLYAGTALAFDIRARTIEPSASWYLGTASSPFERGYFNDVTVKGGLVRSEAVVPEPTTQGETTALGYVDNPWGQVCTTICALAYKTTATGPYEYVQLTGGPGGKLYVNGVPII